MKFLASLASRKLLVAVGAIVTALANKQYDAAFGIAAAYVLAQAHVDAKLATATVQAQVDAAAAQVTAAAGDPRFQ